MPKFTITIINDEFHSTEDLECADIMAARRKGVASALAIGSEAVAAGKAYFGAEVILDQDGKETTKFVVSAGASMLKLPE